MKSNFENKYLKETKEVREGYLIAKRNHDEAKEKYAAALKTFLENSIYANSKELEEQYSVTLECENDSMRAFAWEFPYEAHHPADIYQSIIDCQISLIDDEQDPDIEAPSTQENFYE